MGMFDYLRCHVPVDGRDLSKFVFRTNDTPFCDANRYEAVADGTLWVDFGTAGRRAVRQCKTDCTLACVAEYDGKRLNLTLQYWDGKLIHSRLVEADLHE
jgi:hypothetical protein